MSVFHYLISLLQTLRIHKPGSFAIPRPPDLFEDEDDVQDDTMDEDEEESCSSALIPEGDADKMPVFDIFSILDCPWEEELVIEHA